MANEKSARPEECASASRAMHSERTSGVSCIPPYAFGTTYLNHPALPSERTSARQVSSTGARSSSLTWFAIHSRKLAANMRCSSEKNGHCIVSVGNVRTSVSLEHGRPFFDERMIGALKILAVHAPRLHLCFEVDGGINVHRPLFVQTAFRDSVRGARAVGKRAREVDRVCEHGTRIADAVVEAPAFGLVAEHGASGVQELTRAALADDARQYRARSHVGAG